MVVLKILLIWLLSSETEGLQSSKIDIRVGQKFEPPYISEHKTAEKQLCVTLCLKVSMKRL